MEARAYTSDPTSEEVLDAFITEILCRYGAPSELRQDNGSNLGSELAREVYQLCGVELKVSNSYRHQTAGGVERYNDTFVSALRASDAMMAATGLTRLVSCDSPPKAPHGERGKEAARI